MKRISFSRKLVSIFLTILIVSLTVPVAFAATETLSTSNVKTWPTLSYNNPDGKMYYGQTLAEGITINDDEVVLDASGNQVAGHFVFIDSTIMPDASTSTKAHLQFVPDDTDAYSGFQKKRSVVTYSVEPTTLVLVDENNPPVAASTIEQGAMLSTVKIIGGEVKNPYNESESEAANATWYWVNPKAIVTESGEYEAKLLTSSSYVTFTTMIQVNLEKTVAIPSISENPVVEIEYTPNTKWGDITLNGGKAVITNDDGTTSEIAGTFSVADSWKTTTITASCTEIGAVFTPDDTDSVMAIDFKLPVTVNKAVPAFKTDDESGIPTITMPYGTKLDSSLDHKIKPLIDVGVPVSLAYKDLDGNNLSYSGTTPVVGTHEIQVRVNIDNTNYEQFTMLTFNLEITGFTANCIMVPVGTEGYKIIDQNLAYNATKPTGTYTVSYTIDGEKQPDITVKYEELFKIDMTQSGKYEYSIKYNEIENDPFEIDSFTFSSEEKLDRNVKIGDSSQKYTYGDKVSAVAPATDPSMPDKPYYGFAGWEAKGIELTDEQISSPEITFDMPDEDVELNATYKFSMKLFFEWIWQQIVQFFTFFINAMKDLFALSVA